VSVPEHQSREALRLTIALRRADQEAMQGRRIEFFLRGVVPEPHELIQVKWALVERLAQRIRNRRIPRPLPASVKSDGSINTVAVNRPDIVGEEDAVRALVEIGESRT